MLLILQTLAVALLAVLSYALRVHANMSLAATEPVCCGLLATVWIGCLLFSGPAKDWPWDFGLQPRAKLANLFVPVLIVYLFGMFGLVPLVARLHAARMHRLAHTAMPPCKTSQSTDWKGAR